MYLQLVLFIFFIFILIIYLFPPRESFAEDADADTIKKANIESCVDVIYWINLDHRTDRREEFEREVHTKLDFPRERIIRVSGIYDKDRGHLGCSKSHIQCLQMFLESHYRNCLIMEDDFHFIVSPHDIQNAFEELDRHHVTYDVCMLSGNVFEEYPSEYSFLNTIVKASTTSGYLVSRDFAPQLLQNYKEGCQKLEDSYNHSTNPLVPYDHYSAIDQYWMKLQAISNWYIFNPKLGTQRESHSDIMGGVVNYKL
jgi:hypothetical protein